jgi:drug/metabolite transporter (DMT)-like permease
VTIVLSLWLLSEPLSANLALGGALILAGVYLGALHRHGHEPG